MCPVSFLSMLKEERSFHIQKGGEVNAEDPGDPVQKMNAQDARPTQPSEVHKKIHKISPPSIDAKRQKTNKRGIPGNSGARRRLDFRNQEEAIQIHSPKLNLSKKQHSESPALHGTNSRSSDLSPSSDPPSYQRPSALSSQPLGSLGETLPNPVKKCLSSSYISLEKHSRSKSIGVLKSRQQEPLQSVRLPDIGRTEIGCLPNADPLMTSSEPHDITSNLENTRPDDVKDKIKTKTPKSSKGVLLQTVTNSANSYSILSRIDSLEEKEDENEQEDIQRLRKGVQQIQLQEQKQNLVAAAAAPEEKCVILFKPMQKGTACRYRPIVIDGNNVAML